jgi:outer membrane protein OmpA-like peptidoglycan-associated protein
MLLLTSSSPVFCNQLTGDTTSYESFNVSVNFEKIGRKSFSALYQEPNEIYLPIAEVFDFLKIVHNVSNQGRLLSGYLLSENRTFEINYSKYEITYQGKKYAFSKNDMLMEMGVLFLKKEALEQVFDFRIKFDFRSLSAEFGADYELPLARLIKIEKARENLKKIQDVVVYDSVMPRNYHWFRPGMVDWSIASNQSQTYTGETRFGLATGVELLGGETNVWLTYSDKYHFEKSQQRYSWRWVDNNASIVKQVQIGRIYNRSIASLLSPVDGFVVTNASTAIQKALGTYQISNTTEPNWIVELYINNVLMDYTKTDPSGFYTFKVPIVYGTSNVTLRFYGPNGEERQEEKTFNMPYNMLPKGEFEYRVSGGQMLDVLHSKYGRAEANVGVSSWLTMGAGFEYLSSITTGPSIPFANFSFQPIPKLIITGEYAYQVRTKATLNYNFDNYSVLELNYSKYKEGQKAIIFNYLEERAASYSIPFKLNKLSVFMKTSLRQNIYSNFSYNTGEMMLSGYYHSFNANLSNFINWTDASNTNIYCNLAMGLKIGKGVSIRPSLQYNYISSNFISTKVEIEKQVLTKGYLTLGYENNFLSKYSSFNIAFRYDFSFMSTYVSTYFQNKQIQTAESARGSFAFGSGNKYVHASAREAVGRSGISIIPFIDVNFNGIQDNGEPTTNKLNVRCSGGQVFYRPSDSIVRIVGLEPFVDYTVLIDESNFENVALRLSKHNIKVTTDPNQFKTIRLAVHPMGELSGMVLDDTKKGIGRILLNIKDENDSVIAKVQSESDGYFSYLGLKPGKYKVSVDSLQQVLLNVKSNPKELDIKESVVGDVKDIGSIELVSRSNVEVISPEITIGKLTPVDKSIKYVVLFDFDQSEVRAEFSGSLQKLAQIMKEYDCVTLEIQGHTDSKGSSKYNLKLSNKRAKSVSNLLIKNGINPNRLKIKGFGETTPVPGNENRNAQERSKNRRVVFKNISENGCVNVDSILNLNELSNKKTSINVDKIASVTTDEKKVINTRYLFSILFGFNKKDLKPENLVVINALTRVLQNNKCLQLQIMAYTDSDGDSVYNKKLSESRAKAIANALEINGIAKQRLETYGFGEANPLNGNKNAVEKSVNRRAIFNAAKSGCIMNLDSLLYLEMPRTFNGISKEMYILEVNKEFMIQVGSFNSYENAILLANKFKTILPENIYISEVGKMFKVRIGYMKTRKEALKIASIIESIHLK